MIIVHCTVLRAPTETCQLWEQWESRTTQGSRGANQRAGRNSQMQRKLSSGHAGIVAFIRKKRIDMNRTVFEFHAVQM